ncbi:histidinol-phosphate transaminase [Desulfosediminicola flagellatus]|uniref:histidinol-phosphate transaminase n=1 Tax=Desulfosediminicola flagellatus TaxID=2569541 RepID=UPI001C3E30B6|nr:histidinol-phosphate transaminase [Desulfosediminicola flagellatus]
MKLQIPENIQAITPYPPGKPLDELEREYGVKNSIKLASNENPWGPSPKAIAAIQDALGSLNRYPDGSSYYLTQAIAKHFGMSAQEIVLGSGSNEVIEFLVKAFVGVDDEVITSHPSFLMYQKFVQVRGGKNLVLPLKGMRHDLQAILASVTARTRLVFLDNPNNPTGTYINPADLYTFLSAMPEHVIVVLDEAYVDFMDMSYQVDIYSLIKNSDGRCPVVSLRTFSKAYGLSGLRVGFGLMAKEIADCLHKVRQPFNMNSLAQVAALAALEDTAFFDQTIKKTITGRNILMRGVEELGCKSYPSETNFFLIDVGGDADALYNAMLYKGVIVRSMRAYGFPQCIRITIGTDEENARFLNAFSECLKELEYV